MASIKCTMYQRPDGKQVEVELKSVKPEDANWFISNGIKVSMEEITTGQYIVYADYGAKKEYIELSRGRNCWDTLSALRKAIESIMGNK